MKDLAALAPLAPTIRGLCFDVDDTVTTDGVVDPEAFQALHDLRAAGVHRIAVTGRPLGFAEVIARTWPVDAAVGENGAGWIGVRRGRLHRGYLEPEEVRADHARALARLRDEIAEALPEIRETRDAWARRCDLAFDVAEFDRHPPERVAALVARIEAAGAKAVVSSVHAHAALGAASKPLGACGAARDLLGLDLAAERERWLFVGDSGNDADAFAWFPHTVGVANVREALDALPDPPGYVTGAARGAGFAQLARLVLSAQDAG